MTMTTERPCTDEALAKIDEFLANISHQTIVTQTDVADFALDLRLILSTVTPEPYNDL